MDIFRLDTRQKQGRGSVSLKKRKAKRGMKECIHKVIQGRGREQIGEGGEDVEV